MKPKILMSFQEQNNNKNTREEIFKVNKIMDMEMEEFIEIRGICWH